MTRKLKAFLPEIQSVFRRFPLAILMVAGFCATILYDKNLANLAGEMRMRLLGGFVLAAYLAVGFTLWGEGRQKDGGRHISPLFKLPVVLAGFALGYFFRDLNFLILAAIGAAILFLGNAPFFRKPRNDVGVWDFTHKLWTAVLFTVAGSIIYMIGIYSISQAMKVLLGLNIRDIVEDIFLPIGLAFLAPLAWLSMLPGVDDEDDGDSLRNPGFISRAVGFIGTWILAPLTLIYAVILVLYGVKIIMLGQLPNGEIGKLVTPFLIIGTLTWLILDPPFIQEKALAKWYSRLWFPLSIPAAILLAIAAFIRIGEYGWTVQRYLLILAAFWALGIALWYLVKRQKGFDIRIIPGFAAILLALSALGPWGAVSVSTQSQFTRLKQALAENKMLDENGYLRPLAELSIGDEDTGRQAYGAINWLLRAHKTEKVLSFLPKDEDISALKFDAIKDKGHFKRPYKSNDYDEVKIKHRFAMDKVKPARLDINTYSFNNSKQLISVAGYDWMTDPSNIRFIPKMVKTGKNSAMTGKREKYGEFVLGVEDNNLVVTRGTEELARFPIWDWLKKQPVNANNEINLNPRIVLFEKDGQSIAIHILHAQYSKNDQGFASLNYVVLLKNIHEKTP